MAPLSLIDLIQLSQQAADIRSQSNTPSHSFSALRLKRRGIWHIHWCILEPGQMLLPWIVVHGNEQPSYEHIHRTYVRPIRPHIMHMSVPFVTVS